MSRHQSQTRTWGPASTWFIVAAVVTVVVLMVERRFPLGWTVRYKGHSIQVQNHAFLGERLLIDGKLVDRGRVRMNVTLRGTIEGGAGAGERITAQTKATFSSFFVPARGGSVWRIKENAEIWRIDELVTGSSYRVVESWIGRGSSASA